MKDGNFILEVKQAEAVLDKQRTSELPGRQKWKRRGNMLRIETIGFGDTRCLSFLFGTQAACSLERKLKNEIEGRRWT